MIRCCDTSVYTADWRSMISIYPYPFIKADRLTRLPVVAEPKRNLRHDSIKLVIGTGSTAVTFRFGGSITERFIIAGPFIIDSCVLDIYVRTPNIRRTLYYSAGGGPTIASDGRRTYMALSHYIHCMPENMTYTVMSCDTGRAWHPIRQIDYRPLLMNASLDRISEVISAIETTEGPGVPTSVKIGR
jgi:hypothetical protein